MAENTGPWSWDEVLEQELIEIALGRARRAGATVDKIGPSNPRDHLVGLGLSGGGIRSATFNLGVLQAFARSGLLRRFDYLSTVSGGGYIGSWLSAWIARSGLDEVEATLSAERDDRAAVSDGRPKTAEPDPIRFLRNYSNYVTPRVGAFTDDTWAVVAIYLRNLLLNLVILIGVLGLILTIPRLIVTGWSCLGGLNPVWQPRLVSACYASALVLFVVAATATQRSLNYLAGRADAEAGVRWVYAYVALPFLLATLLLTIGLGSPVTLFHRVRPVVAWPLVGAGAHLVVWALAKLFARSAAPTTRSKTTDGGWLWLAIGMLICGAVGGLSFWALGNAAAQIRPSGDLWTMVVFGPPAVLLSCLIASSLHTGFNGRSLSDEQREWLGRHGGLLLRHVLLWLTFFSTAAYGPRLVPHFLHWSASGGLWTRLGQFGVTTAWIGTTMLGLVAGRGRETGDSAHARNDRGPDTRTSVWEWLARAAPYVFAAGLLLLLSTGVEALWWKLGARPVSPAAASSASLPFGRLDVEPTRWTFVCLGSVGVFLALLIPRVDINEFSLHHLYRNRLMRCYLGASNPGRLPHPFTGFDAGDDLRLADLLPSKVAQGKTPGPFHLVNTTLNLVGGGELAWQKRRSASFTVSPLASGYEFIKRKGRPLTHRLAQAAYRPTDQYAAAGGGMTLGTAMAISGAAASPNMGFHSSAPLAFLMTIFNVRLGWWAPNPRDPHAWNQAGPRFGLLYLFRELLGRSNDRSRNVYVSDGGHFENLGLYELVRRRCRTIVLCDASQDPRYQYDDLSNAIQRCRVDFGANIQFESGAAPRRPGQADGARPWSRGRATIRYADGLIGVLIYLKPSLSAIDDDISEDIRSYLDHHPEFPHETTADQWFDENQFECYRQLGFTIGELRSPEIQAELRPHVQRPLREQLKSTTPVAALLKTGGVQSEPVQLKEPPRPVSGPAAPDRPAAAAVEYAAKPDRSV